MEKSYKPTKKGLELVCEKKYEIGESKTGYVIGDHLWLWDDEEDMLVTIIRRSDRKVLYTSSYIQRTEKKFGVTLEELIRTLIPRR